MLGKVEITSVQAGLVSPQPSVLQRQAGLNPGRWDFENGDQAGGMGMSAEGQNRLFRSSEWKAHPPPPLSHQVPCCPPPHCEYTSLAKVVRSLGANEITGKNDET